MYHVCVQDSTQPAKLVYESMIIKKNKRKDHYYISNL